MTQSNQKPNSSKIIRDNIEMHDAPGYAEFYDKTLGLIKNSWERKFFLTHLYKIVSDLKQQFNNRTITALDLGAGTGNLTLELLKSGIEVTALDISEKMLERLKENVRTHQLNENKLTVICKPVDDFLVETIKASQNFHLVCACSFYHHLPDYIRTLRLASKTVLPCGYLYLTHEPMYKSGISEFSKLMQRLDFKLWRLQVHISKLFGYAKNVDKFYNPENQADYWDMTSGCNQYEICNILDNEGFKVKLNEYDSKRSRMLHHLCKLLGTKTLFAITAKRKI